ncbi:carbohydrate ABC transporter permease [Leifsonia sp. Leaf264]|uniref:carbohydrate ABC transporter permease n=1 Tax=Leifsonia sp. Leaf264 TaxID=1736314 RepID=UPI000701D295|nr:sugar ABC transporter permease [Leifsonia sp. Leaf264]KQO97486.1 ABC transporter permease [Leifsonia sp. Leaf264]
MKSVFSDRRAAIVLLGPALLVYVVVMLLPVLNSLGYTFFTGSPLTGFTFNGLDNITRLFSDPDVLTALLFTLRYALVVTVLQVALGYGLSLFYLFVLRKSSTLVRTLVFFPVVLPTVAVGLLFQRLFAIVPQSGIVNSVVEFFGGDPVSWFNDAGTAFWVIVIMDLWRSMGFYAVLLYAGLLDIPDDIVESANLDGASGWRLIRHIILPLSLPVLLSSIIFSINGTLKVFDSVLALTNGGPGNSTTPLTLYMFQTAFSYGDYGYGSTIALLLTLICLLVTVFIFRSSRRDLTKG